MKLQAKTHYRVATLVLILLLVACFFLGHTHRPTVIGAKTFALKISSPLAPARDALVDVGEEKIRAFRQDREMPRTVAESELDLEGRSLQWITVPGNNGSLQDERAASATIQGLVTNTRTGRPIAGARVSLEPGRAPVDRSTHSYESSASAVTNERGRFRLERVEQRMYRLRAAKRGYLSSSFRVVEVEAGKTETQEIPLYPLAKLSGRVLNDSNHPVKEARVGVFIGSGQSSVAWRQLLSEQGLSILTTITKSQGEFELFVPYEEERVTLVALALGHAPSRIGPLSARASQARIGIRLRLSRGLEAHGRIVNEGRMPIPDATIFAHSLELGEAGLRLGFGDLEPRITSDADGRIVLRGLEEGAYKLRVSHASYAINVVPGVEIKSKGANRIPDTVLLPQAEIRGRVTDTKDQPVREARISGFSREVGNSEAISDDNGSFVLSGFASGMSVGLTASADGYSNASKGVRAPSKDIVLVLSQLGVLRGRVEDAETRTPLKEFHIHAARVQGRSFRSEDGAFKWEGVATGRRTFIAQAAGYRAAEIAGIEVRPGEPTEELVFSLTRGMELTGRVVDAVTGDGLPNVTLRYLMPSESEPPFWAVDWNKQVTDADGNFKYDGLPAGKVTIIAKSELYVETRRTVAPGEESFVEIRLAKGASVSGRVVGLDGTTPLSWARVNLLPVASMSGTRYSEDKSGVFSFSGLAAGPYQLTAETNLGQTKPQEIVLRENEQVTGLLLNVQTGATIRGKVTGLRPDESRVEISLIRQGVSIGRASTDTDGMYAVRGVPEGWVDVMAHTYSDRIVSKSVEIPKGVLEFSLNIEFPLGARLSGRVTRGGQAVANRIVSAFLRDPKLVGGTGKTDHNGLYTIEGLSEGDYFVSLEREWTKSLRISGDTALDIELSAPSLSGRVLEANSGQPLSGVTLQVQQVNPAVDANTARTAITDSQGRFSIESLEPGRYQIIAHRSGFKIDTQALSVPALIELVISLAPVEGIAIRVRDGINGLALRRVGIDALSDTQSMHLNVALDETGRGDLPQLPPGRYNLLVSSDGYAPKSVIGWTVPGPRLDLSLTPGGHLEIHVDSAFIGAKSSLVDQNGISPRVAQTEFALSQPTFIPRLAPGEYTLLVKLPEQTKRYKVDIAEGQITVLQVK